jgi:hypothetical protein
LMSMLKPTRCRSIARDRRRDECRAFGCGCDVVCG